MSKVLLMRDLSEDMVAAIEQCKDRFDLKTNTAAVEMMVTNYFKILEQSQRINYKYTSLANELRLYKRHKDKYEQAQADYATQDRELRAMIQNIEEEVSAKYQGT